MASSRGKLVNDAQKVKSTFNIFVPIMPELALPTHPNPPRAPVPLQPVTPQAENCTPISAASV